MASKFSEVIGLTDLRRRLRALPPALTADIKNELRDVTNATQKDAIRFAPFDQRSSLKRKNRGVHLRDAIGQKIANDGMEAAIGSTKRIIGARLFRQAGWRAKFVLFGTKGGVIRSGRRRGTIIPPQPANNYLSKAFEINRQRYTNRVGAAVLKALFRADNR